MPFPIDPPRFNEPQSLVDGIELTVQLRLRLGKEGLHVVLPLGQDAFDEVCARAGGPSIDDLLRGGAGAIVVADGGPGFFARFAEAEARIARPGHLSTPPAGGDAHPLDDYTRGRVGQAVADVLSVRGVPFRILFPFGDATQPIPFQRLGQAAGLPEPGPLGLQIHPVYGPWWAYRALVVVGVALVAEAPVTAPCADCPRPCVVACPAQAVTAPGFVVDRCVDHRLAKLECRTSCAARIACPVGATNQYPFAQLDFHMRASLIQASRHRHLSTR